MACHRTRFMIKSKHPAGPPMTLANMRALGVQRLLVSCLNHACRHNALLDVSSYPAERDQFLPPAHVIGATHDVIIQFLRREPSEHISIH
jgi:hypothetical protein